jgi:PAS domain S-box-containing protein
MLKFWNCASAWHYGCFIAVSVLIQNLLMGHTLQILHLEDDPDYARLVESMLHDEGVQSRSKIVSSRAEFQSALEAGGYDLILADYSLPDLTGIEALALSQRICPGTPFLLISGTIAEQAAIESLKGGATDYVLKHWPERLVPAIRRAAREVEDRAQRREIESQLMRKEQYFRNLTENSLDVVSVLNIAGMFTYNSPSLKRVLGFEPADLQGMNAFDFVHPDDLALARESFEFAAQHPDQTITLEFRYRHKDGTWHHLEVAGRSHFSDPDIQGLIINSRDVSDRKKAEDEVRENEQHYRLIFGSNTTPMWVFDQKTLAFLEVNEAAVQQYGYSREEFLKMTVRQLLAEEDSPAMIEYLHNLVAENNPSRLDFAGMWRHRKKDGSLIDVELKWSTISYHGKPASLTMANDITERKRREHRDASLAMLGKDLSSATTPSEAAQIIKTVAGDLFRWDTFTLNIYVAEQDLISPILNMDTDRQGNRYEIPVLYQHHLPSRMARRVMEHGAELILRSDTSSIPDDTKMIGEVTRPSASLLLAPVRNRTKVIGILSVQSYTPKAYNTLDLVTLQTLADHCGGALERIRAEQACRESDQRFKDLFEGSPDAVFVEDFHGVVLDVNPAACKLHNLSREELLGRTVTDLVPEEFREEVARNFKLLADGTNVQVEGFSLTSDGRKVPVEVRSNLIQFAGKPAVLLHVRDVSERKEAEAALRNSESLFHSVWENSADGMCLTDEEGTIVAVNEALCRLTCLSRAELDQKPLRVIYEGLDPAEAARIMSDYRENFRSRRVQKCIERRLTLRSREMVVVEENISFVELPGMSSLRLTAFRDVTAQKRLEDQFRQAQKMEAIGQLAGGVAHDFNNILTVIHGHASLLLESSAQSGPASRSSQQIVQAAERAAGLTRQLLTFSRRQVMQPRRLDMNEVVSNMTKMLSRILGEDIALQLNYSPQPALVQADSGMVEQVLLNLAVNSRDAMPRGGLLTLRISLVTIEADQLAQHPEAQPGRYVCLHAGDSGCGIPRELLPRIFEPFFTTKEVGKGTGLGLATVYGIVKQHQGWIEVESEVGKGTHFQVYLPAAAETVETVGNKAPQQSVRGGSETILVVEDEAPVRELVCNLLASHGYKIFQAESGQQALAVWQKCREQIDLLLTDLVMPDRLNGRELAEKLLSERPGLKVIFSSGYSADVVGKDFVLRDGLNYLQKPYHPRQLALAVRDCLDSAA